MKTGIMIGMIVAAIVAGGAGGFVVTEVLSGDDDARPRVAAETTEPAPRPRPIREGHGPDYRDLERRFDGLESRVKKLDNRESDELKEEIAALRKRIDEIEEGSVALKGADIELEGADGEAGDVGDVIEKRVEAILERREEAEQEERRQQWQERMERRREQEKERVVAALAEKLSLTPLQQENVKTKIEEYQEKRGELWSKAREARSNDETFDMRGELAKVETEAKASIEEELTLSQVSSFRELLGDDGDINDIGREGRRGGFGRRR